MAVSLPRARTRHTHRRHPAQRSGGNSSPLLSPVHVCPCACLPLCMPAAVMGRSLPHIRAYLDRAAPAWPQCHGRQEGAPRTVRGRPQFSRCEMGAGHPEVLCRWGGECAQSPAATDCVLFITDHTREVEVVREEVTREGLSESNQAAASRTHRQSSPPVGPATCPRSHLEITPHKHTPKLHQTAQQTGRHSN